MVVEEVLFGLQVAAAGVDAATLAAGQPGADGLGVDGGDGLGEVPAQDADRVGGDPRLGVGSPSACKHQAARHWVGRAARCLLGRSCSVRPPSEPRGHLLMHVALR